MIIGIFGLGSIGRRHLSNLLKFKKKYSITKIKGFDLKIDKVKKFIKPHKDLVISNNFKMIAEKCDIAFICSPTNTHIAVINRLLKFSKPHLYLEKPFSSTIKGCEQIMKKYQKIRKKIAVGYMLVNHPVVQFTKSLIEKKKIGKIVSVRAESGFYLPFWHPWENYKDFYMSHKKEGGGALLDISHEINLLQYLLGKVTKVYGKVLTCSTLGISSDDLTVANLEFKNNIYGQVQLDLLQFDKERSFKIIGDKGVIKGDIKNNQVHYSTNKKNTWTKKKFDFDFNKIYYLQMDQFFLRLIKNKKNNLVNDKDAFHTMEIIEGIRKSSSTNRRINL